MRIEGKLAEIAGIDASGVRLEVAQTRFSAIDAAETVIRKDPAEEGLVRVSYLTHDQDGGDYWNDADGRGSLQLFRTQSDRDDYVVLEKARGEIPLIVDQYDHGGLHFSIQNSRFYPDSRWDVAPRGVYVPCREVQDRYRGEVGEATRLIKDPEQQQNALQAAMSRMVADSNAVLEEYSSWANGHVYGVVHETWKITPDGRTEMVDEESCWGLIGWDCALETLREETSQAEPPAIEPAF